MKTITLDFPVPDWAEWIAQDESGEVTVFECEPVIHETYKIWYNDSCRYEEICRYNRDPNWRETLRRV